MELIRARSDKYPDSEEEYVDKTCYDKKEKSLDIGYQRLKIFNVKLYPELSLIEKLFIDYNNLKLLPDPTYLPNLTELTCSTNCLNSIPFYPKLTFLNIAHNSILDCRQYHNSNIEYFDCSYNPGFKLNFRLPKCTQLYINNNDITTIDLNLVPKIKLLDCSNNKLDKIIGGANLIELNIQHNNITQLPYWPQIVRINADHNKITTLQTYPLLVAINISYNKLTKIADQPKIRKLIATNNDLITTNIMPNLELVDLAHNNLAHFKMPPKVEYVSLEFNPIIKLELDTNVLSHIKELQVGFTTYTYIYQKYYNSVNSVNVQPHSIKLEEMLRKLNKVFDSKIIDYIFRYFHNTKFQNRADALFKITLKLYWKYFRTNNIKTMAELIKTTEFKYLLDNITKLYYKTIIVTIYFNEY